MWLFWDGEDISPESVEVGDVAFTVVPWFVGDGLEVGGFMWLASRDHVFVGCGETRERCVALADALAFCQGLVRGVGSVMDESAPEVARVLALWCADFDEESEGGPVH